VHRVDELVLVVDHETCRPLPRAGAHRGHDVVHQRVAAASDYQVDNKTSSVHPVTGGARRATPTDPRYLRVGPPDAVAESIPIARTISTPSATQSHGTCDDDQNSVS